MTTPSTVNFTSLAVAISKHGCSLIQMKEVLLWLSQVSPLTEQSKEYLSGIFERRQLARGETLLTGGVVCRNLYFIAKGRLYCYYVRGKREEICWNMKAAGAVVSIESFYSRLPGGEFVQALAQSELYSVSYAQVQFMMGEFPDFVALLGALITRSSPQWLQPPVVCSPDAAERCPPGNQTANTCLMTLFPGPSNK